MDLKRELLALQQELSTRKEGDPLEAFQPTKAQKPFADDILDGKVDEAWFCGSNRSGKSSIGAYVAATLARKGRRNPPSSFSGSGKTFMEVRDRATSGWVVSLDFPNSRDVAQPKLFDNGNLTPGQIPPLIPEREIKEWRATDQILKLKSGSLIGFKSADSPPTKLAGAGKDYIWFDEEPPIGHYEEATIRVEAGRSLTVFGTATLLPQVGRAGGISWLFEKIINPWKHGKLGERRKVYTSSIWDNPYIGKQEIAMLEALFPPGSKMHDIRIRGELIPGLGGARAYHSFERHLHVRALGPIDNYRPIAWCWDFNVEPMITVIGQRHNDKFRFYKELVLEQGSIPDMAEYFFNVMSEHRAEIWIYGDATGAGRRAQYGESDYRVIQNEMRRFGLPFRMKVRETNPPVSDRLNATNRALKDELGAINIEVDESCEELIADFEGVLTDPAGGIKKSHNTKDPYYRRTHASDAATYWIAYEAPVRAMSIGERVIPKIKDVSYRPAKVQSLR